VACRGLPCGESPSCDSCRISPSRQAQATVSTVAVSKPTTIRGRYPDTRNAQDPTFLPLTNQLTTCRPGIVEVILFT
jgi:hypothetical protein